MRAFWTWLTKPDPAPVPGQAMAETPPGTVPVDSHSAPGAFTLRVGYGTLAVAAMLLCSIAAGAYLVGKHVGRGPQPLFSGTTTEQLRGQPTRPEVVRLPLKQVIPDGGDQEKPAQPPPPLPRKRTSGLNYVLVQSYPDKEMAATVVNLLAQNGIECTIEQGIAGWKQSWYQVVGLQSFPSQLTGNAEFQAYVRNLRQISEQHAKRSFKAFEPIAIKWK